MSKDKYIYKGIQFRKDDVEEMSILEAVISRSRNDNRSFTYIVKEILKEWKNTHTQI